MGRTSDARVRLINGAHALIWSSSYGAVTIEAICERAGVKKGSFYYFFDSKADLAITAINALWEERSRLTAGIFRPEVPPVERIMRYLGLVVESQLQTYAETGKLLGCPLFTLGSEISTQDEELRLLVKEIMSKIAAYFESAIRDALDAGEIEGTNAALKARQLWAFYEGTLTRARIENNPELLRHLCADALALIGAGPQLVAA